MKTLTEREKQMFRQSIKTFLEAQELKVFDKAGITDITFAENEKDITISIFLNRPGYLIGAGGSRIASLVRFLYIVRDDKAIKLDVQQTKLWD